jgi:hypothetical protein
VAGRDLGGSGGSAGLFQIGHAGGSDAIEVVYWGNANHPQQLTVYGDGVASANWISAAPTVVNLIVTPGGRRYGSDGFSPFMKNGDYGAIALKGAVLGMSPGGPANTTATVSETASYGVLTWGSSLNNADDLSVRTSIHALGNTSPRARCNVAILGESVARGFLAPGDMSVGMQLQNRLPKSVRVFDFAKDSAGVGSVGSTFTDRYISEVKSLYSAQNRCNILLIWSGTNDWWRGTPGGPPISVATEQGFIDRLVSAATGDGWTVFVTNMIDRGTNNSENAAQLADMTASINSKAVTNPAWGYLLADLASDPSIGCAGCNRDRTHFGDYIHLTAAGTTAAVVVIVKALSPYISSEE